MLRVLVREELSVGEIARVLQSPQSTASRHLKVLTDGGWLVRRPERTATLYRLSPEGLSPGDAALWEVLSTQFDDLEEAEADDRRLRDVLMSRSNDSLSFFGRFSGEWDAMRGELFGEGFTSLGLLSLIPEHWSIADIGCGTGNVTALLAPHVEHIFAIDQSQPMLDAAKRRLSADGLRHANVSFHQGAAESLPIERKSVDAAVCSLVLHHVVDPVETLAEIASVLRTDRGGGVALVIDMERHSRREFRDQMGHHHLGFGAAEITDHLARAGFGAPRFLHLPSDPTGRGPGLFAATARLAGSSGPDGNGRAKNGSS